MPKYLIYYTYYIFRSAIIHYSVEFGRVYAGTAPTDISIGLGNMAKVRQVVLLILSEYKKKHIFRNFSALQKNIHNYV